MSKPIEKSEEQIAKDKEAVKAMTGAKAAMEAALRRVALLEETLSKVRRDLDHVANIYGDSVHIRTYNYRESNWQLVKASDYFEGINQTIKAVL